VHLSEIEFCETSQNFNSFRQLLFSFFLSVVRIHEIGEIQKMVLAVLNKKALFTDLIFIEGFVSSKC